MTFVSRFRLGLGFGSGRRMNSVTTLEYSARQIFMTMNTKTCSYS